MVWGCHYCVGAILNGIGRSVISSWVYLGVLESVWAWYLGKGIGSGWTFGSSFLFSVLGHNSTLALVSIEYFGIGFCGDIKGFP